VGGKKRVGETSWEGLAYKTCIGALLKSGGVLDKKAGSGLKGGNRGLNRRKKRA